MNYCSLRAVSIFGAFSIETGITSDDQGSRRRSCRVASVLLHQCSVCSCGRYTQNARAAFPPSAPSSQKTNTVTLLPRRYDQLIPAHSIFDHCSLSARIGAFDSPDRARHSPERIDCRGFSNHVRRSLTARFPALSRRIYIAGRHHIWLRTDSTGLHTRPVHMVIRLRALLTPLDAICLIAHSVNSARQ